MRIDIYYIKSPVVIIDLDNVILPETETKAER